MTEYEIFEKLKEALGYKYMYDSLEFGVRFGRLQHG